MNTENLGPAERVINSLLEYKDHMVHNRPGIITPDQRFSTGVRWEMAIARRRCATHPEARVRKDKASGAVTCAECGQDLRDGGVRIVFRTPRGGKQVRVGVLQEDGLVVEAGREVCRYMSPGLFREVAAWMYRQVAEVWKLNNEFAARWASWAYEQENRDLKVILAAFMLCQSRKGDPVTDDGKVVFHDEDYRDVGEAMVLQHRKGKDMNAKMLLRIHEVLQLPEVAGINRELGFARSARRPFLGRWEKAVEKWIRFREENPKVLDGLVRSGQRSQLIALCERVGYRPSSPKFFEVLRWKQSQAKDGRRSIAIGQDVAQAETWEGLTEREVCERIVRDKPGFKRIYGMLPKSVGLTRAVMAAAVEAGSLSDKDLIILTPTLEELGLLDDADVRGRWEAAMKEAEDVRAANVARNVRSREAKEKLQDAADAALQKAVREEVERGIRVYFMVDISGSMAPVIQVAKDYCAKLVQAFPLDRLHVAVFNSAGWPVTIRHASKAGVEQAFRGHAAGGGTDYGAGIRAVQGSRPGPDEDALFFFVGDEEAPPFEAAVRASGISPVAFAFVRVASYDQRMGTFGQGRLDDGRTAVRETASRLGIPCVLIDGAAFEDPYAIPRTLRHLIASTPVGRTAAGAAKPRLTLVDQIAKTELLQKPAWAA